MMNNYISKSGPTLLGTALISALILIGCTTIKSSRTAVSGSGFAYYLPKGVIRLVVVREIIIPEGSQQPLSVRTNIALTNATTVRQVGTNPLQVKFKTNGGLDIPTIGEASASNVITEIETVSYDSTVGTNASMNQMMMQRTNFYISVDTDLIPDKKERYLLQMKPSAWADDNMKIGVSNGLLQTLILSNSDQTLSVFSNLAQAAIQFAKYTALAAGAGPTTTLTTNVYCFDPTDRGERADIISKLSTTFGIKLDLHNIPEHPTKNHCAETAGIFYRTPLKYYITWDAPGSAGAGIAPVWLPNAAPVDRLEFTRASFVAQSYMVLIHDGVPLEIALNKPSQAAAVGYFPLTIANSLISLPLSVTNMLQFKFDVANAENKLAQSQAAAISNQITLFQIKQQLDNLMNSVTNLGSNKVTGQPPGGH